MASFLLANPTQSSIFSCIAVIVSISAFSLFTVCDAGSSLEIFKLRKGLKFTNYNYDADSLDLPTLDAYDLGPLLAPSPSAQIPISSPPEIAPSPYEGSRISDPPEHQLGPSNSYLIGPHYGPTQPKNTRPSLQPTRAPAQSRSPTYAVWCVARPTVPEPVLQTAMDYACGAGADCGPVQPNGPCFQPNTLVAHASYAFNSYWQRTKIVGGTCDFGGTAMLITVDPSFNHCHFVYN